MGNLQRSLIAVIVFTFIFTCIPFTVAYAKAEENTTYEVGVTFLNMRTGPSLDAEIIGQLTVGSKLKTFAKDNGWVKTFYNGKPVWVAEQHLIPLSIDTEKERKKANAKKDKKRKKRDTNLNRPHNSGEKNDTKDTEQATDSKSGDNKPTLQDFLPYFQSRLLDLSDALVEQQVEEPNDREDNSSDEVTEKSNVPQKKKLNAHQPQKPKVSHESIKALENFHFTIDPGHGGKDPGAVIKDTQEKDLTLATAEVVAEHLREVGATVTLTRSRDEFIELENRAAISNQHQSDAFISIHFDSFERTEASGVTTHFSKKGESLTLAQNIHSSLKEHVPLDNRGMKRSNYLVLRKNNQPAVLLELGFMTNPSDWKKIQTKEFQNEVADAILEGLAKFVFEKKSP
ncbi:N-acetylmuramoyl-L-alanine amidase [Virgibacillus soli]|uniref:N-acetylmuramoyl-L-alanine amidase n=1 Tax=Paracerasibacillus soli TaxID=480284 RepID=UPI0035EAAF21